MNNKLCLSLLALMWLTACSDKNKNVDSSNQAKSSAPVSSIKQEAKVLLPEQQYLKVLAKQREINKKYRDAENDALETLQSEKAKIEKLQSEKKTVDVNEQLMKVQIDIQRNLKNKSDELDKELKNTIQNLNITDSDLKNFFYLQNKSLMLQDEILVVYNQLQKIVKQTKKSPTKEELKKYNELRVELNQTNLDIQNKKEEIEVKFATSAKNKATREYFQIMDIMNLENKGARKISEKLLGEDKTIKSEDELNQKIIVKLVPVMQDIITKLKNLELTDPELTDYRDKLVKVEENKIEFSKKAQSIQKDFIKNKKFSAENESFIEQVNQINKEADEQLTKVIDKLIQ